MGLLIKQLVLVVLFCVLTCTVHAEFRYAKGYTVPDIERVYTGVQTSKASFKQKKRSKSIFT